MPEERTPLEQEFVEALLDSKAIDLEATSALVAKYAVVAAKQGDVLTQIIHKRFYWACGWPVELFTQVDQVR